MDPEVPVLEFTLWVLFVQQQKESLTFPSVSFWVEQVQGLRAPTGHTPDCILTGNP